MFAKKMLSALALHVAAFNNCRGYETCWFSAARGMNEPVRVLFISYRSVSR